MLSREDRSGTTLGSHSAPTAPGPCDRRFTPVPEPVLHLHDESNTTFQCHMGCSELMCINSCTVSDTEQEPSCCHLLLLLFQSLDLATEPWDLSPNRGTF